MLNWDKVREELFAEAQAKLPGEDRAAPIGTPWCMAYHDGVACTRAEGHTGRHVACGMTGEVVARWDNLGEGASKK